MLTRDKELLLDKEIHRKLQLGVYTVESVESKKIKGKKIGNKKMVESRLNNEQRH